MFADIQRLPPAHRLICRQKTVRVERYWTLPADHRPIRYKDRRDYTERFKEILCLAVKDRIRSPRLGLALSGGMDSATLAAMVHTVRKTDRPDLQVQAYTLVFDAIVPDEERFYAGLVGERLDLPVHFIAGDDDNLYEGWHEPAFQRPEPLHHPRLRTNIRLYERIVADGIRTTMWGLGLPDYFLTPRAYFLQLLKRLRLFRLARDVSTYALLFRQLPRIGFRGKIKKMLGLLPPSSFWLPEWINPDFERQLNLKARWERLGDYKKLVEAEHPLHPELYKGLLSPIWPAWFEIKDPGSIFFPIEMHYPYMDLRLLNYVLAVPPVPWAKDKHLFRVAMEGILPDAVCHRPKTTLVGNALHVLLQREASAWIDHFDPDPRLSRYIDREKIPRLTENQLSHQNFANERHYKLNLHLNLRPLTLNLWLRSLEATKNPTDQAWA